MSQPTFNIYIPLDKGFLIAYADAACTAPLVAHDIKLGSTYLVAVNFLTTAGGSAVDLDADSPGSLYLSLGGATQASARLVAFTWTHVTTGIYTFQFLADNLGLRTDVGDALVKPYLAEISWYSPDASVNVHTTLSYTLNVHNTAVAPTNAPPVNISTVWYLDDDYLALRTQNARAYGDLQSLMVDVVGHLAETRCSAIIHVGIPASGTFGDASITGGSFSGNIVFKGHNSSLSVLGNLTLGTVLIPPGRGPTPMALIFDRVAAGIITVTGVSDCHCELIDALLSEFHLTGQAAPPAVTLGAGVNAYYTTLLDLFGRGPLNVVTVIGSAGGAASDGVSAGGIGGAVALTIQSMVIVPATGITITPGVGGAGTPPGANGSGSLINGTLPLNGLRATPGQALRWSGLQAWLPTFTATPCSALTGGTAGCLDAIPTAFGAVATGSTVTAVVSGTYSVWQLQVGTTATGLGVTQPADYDAGTNARIWVQLQ